MGDHRFSITVKMTFHGAEGEIKDGWFNWDGGRDGIDSRIIRLLEDVRDQGFSNYDRDTEKYLAEQRKGATSEAERAEYERLKAKFEPGV